jgi:hypothetical protein
MEKYFVHLNPNEGTETYITLRVKLWTMSVQRGCTYANDVTCKDSAQNAKHFEKSK